jgi:hypothetical protein
MNSIALRPTKLIAIVLAITSIAVAAFGPNDAEAKKASKAGATLSIEPSAPGFTGELVSSRESCQNGRRVILFEQKGSRRNRRKDKKVGSDIAQPNGDSALWHVDTGPTGRYYAYVKATRKCKAAVSRSIRPSVD